MVRRVLIFSGIVVIFSIIALSYQLNKIMNQDDEQQNSINRYFAMEKTANELLDMCTQDNAVIKNDKCREAALEIISMCNSLTSRLPVCDDSRIAQLSILDEDVEEKDSSKTSEPIKIPDTPSDKTMASDIDVFTTMLENLRPILQINDDFANTMKRYGMYASDCYSATKDASGQYYADLGVDAINNLAVLGASDPGVIQQWNELSIGVSSMCSADLSHWMEKMTLTAETLMLFDVELEFFNQHMKLANDALLRNQANEPLEFKKESMLTTLHGYSETINEEKISLASTYEQLPPKYLQLHTKIMQYVDAISLSVNKSTNVIGSYDLQNINEASEQFKITTNLKDEVAKMIKEEIDSLSEQ